MGDISHQAIKSRSFWKKHDILTKDVSCLCRRRFLEGTVQQTLRVGMQADKTPNHCQLCALDGREQGDRGTVQGHAPSACTSVPGGVVHGNNLQLA